MSRRIDIGIVAYNKPDHLHAALTAIKQFTAGDWRCVVFDNSTPEWKERTAHAVAHQSHGTDRITYVDNPVNTMYAGGVNQVLKWAESEYIVFCDDDAQVCTPGWDELMAGYLDRFHEIGWIGPNGYGAYPIGRPAGYVEVQWSTGCFWMINRMVIPGIAEFFGDSGLFDETLGHQEECDYCLRIRMAGWKCAWAPEVQAIHAETSTHNPAAIERINRGVVNFVNKWTRYFGGKHLNYHSPNVLRWEDWPPNALYMEEVWRQEQPGLNAGPQKIFALGREYDLIRVPRLASFYTNRVI